MSNTLEDLFQLKNTPRFEDIKTTSTPFDIFRKLNHKFERAFIFESLDGPRELVESSIIGFDPKYVISCDSNTLIVYQNNEIVFRIKTKDPLTIIKNHFPRIINNTIRYIGGLVGYFSYEAIQYWEKIPMKKCQSFPLIKLGWYEDGLVYDHKRKKLEYFYFNESRLKEINRIIDGRISGLRKSPTSISSFRRSVTKNDFESKVNLIKNNLRKGDIFQAVLSKKIKFIFDANPILIYETLRKINPSPYMFFLRDGPKVILGASPEMLLRITNCEVETFPIAGSRPVSADSQITEKNKLELLSDPKEIAEHTMLVDLARNDLGKVCVFGSVITPELMKVKKFSHVQHMVSHVVGKLDNKFDMFDAFKAVFPAGTISGAPKIRAMEIISMLEQDSRGPYAGAIGYFSFNGGCDFAITIRSVFIDKNKCYTQSGAGIVIDSIPEKEYLETEAKSMAVISTLKSISNINSISKDKSHRKD